MTDKKILYSLIEDVLDARISVKQFCKEFTYQYDFNIKDDDLNQNERDNFYSLSMMANRYSDIEYDLEHYDCYYNDDQIIEKIEAVKKNLS